MMTPRKKSKAQILKEVRGCKSRIAKERDKLRDLTSELDEIINDCDEAVDYLGEAVDAISRYL